MKKKVIPTTLDDFKGRTTVAVLKEKDLYSAGFLKKDIILRSAKEDLKGSQRYQLNAFHERRNMQLNRVEELTEQAFKHRKKPLNLKQEYNVKQSIITTADRIGIPTNHPLTERLNALDNDMLNELYQIAPDLLDSVFIYEVEYVPDGHPAAGARWAPDRMHQLVDLLDAYDRFVGTRGRFI